AHRLDAIVTLTASPAWLTDYVLGDHDVFHTSAPSAVAGDPPVTVMAGEECRPPAGPFLLRPPGGAAAPGAPPRHPPPAPPPPPRRRAREPEIACAHGALARRECSFPAGTRRGTLPGQHGHRRADARRRRAAGEPVRVRDHSL